MNLAEQILQSPDFERPEIWYVSVYRDHQLYGGPEEGGWWYNRKEYLGSVSKYSYEEAERWLAETKCELDRVNHEERANRARNTANLPDMDSPYQDTEGYIPIGWGDGGTLSVVLEKERGSLETIDLPRPHYE